MTLSTRLRIERATRILARINRAIAITIAITALVYALGATLWTACALTTSCYLLNITN